MRRNQGHEEGARRRARLGLGGAGLRKALNGTAPLLISHVLLVLDALGISPGQFFRAVYPKEEREPRTLDRFRELKGGLKEEGSPVFDDRVRRALLRLLKEPARSEGLES